MKSNTQLLIEYCDRTKNRVFPECVEAAIEKDYPKNHELYTDKVFRYIEMMCILRPKINPEKLIEIAKESGEKSSKSSPGDEHPTEIPATTSEQ